MGVKASARAGKGRLGEGTGQAIRGRGQASLWPGQETGSPKPAAPPTSVVDAGSTREVRPRIRQNREQRVLQDFLMAESLLAVRLAEGVGSEKELEAILTEKLPQNSLETRARYAQSILRWFFADGPDGFVFQVWRAYRDESIERDILRVLYLRAEPIVGDCVTQALYPLAEGMSIPGTFFDGFLARRLGSADIPENTRKRLKTNLGKLGFLVRSRVHGDRLSAINSTRTAFLLLLHYLFAREEPRTVELSRLFADPFWKYLGIKSEDVVRAILRSADASRSIGKYVVADQLEQITTCYSLKELLSQRVVL